MGVTVVGPGQPPRQSFRLAKSPETSRPPNKDWHKPPPTSAATRPPESHRKHPTPQPPCAIPRASAHRHAPVLGATKTATARSREEHLRVPARPSPEKALAAQNRPNRISMHLQPHVASHHQMPTSLSRPTRRRRAAKQPGRTPPRVGSTEPREGPRGPDLAHPRRLALPAACCPRISRRRPRRRAHPDQLRCNTPPAATPACC
jgi:hypothetical protein